MNEALPCDREVFARMLANDGMLSQVEYKIYLQWFDEFTRDLPKEHVFYIRTDPSIAAQRVAKRARPGESITLRVPDALSRVPRGLGFPREEST